MSNELKCQCAWCKLWRVNGQWVELVYTGDGSNVTHGMCPACVDKMDKEITAVSVDGRNHA